MDPTAKFTTAFICLHITFMEDEILYGFDYFHTIHRRVCEGWKYFGVMYKILDRFSEILLRLEKKL